MASFGMEPAEVRIPRAALDAMAAALSVQTVVMRTWPDGIDWFYPNIDVGHWRDLVTAHRTGGCTAARAVTGHTPTAPA